MHPCPCSPSSAKMGLRAREEVALCPEDDTQPVKLLLDRFLSAQASGSGGSSHPSWSQYPFIFLGKVQPCHTRVCEELDLFHSKNWQPQPFYLLWWPSSPKLPGSRYSRTPGPPMPAISPLAVCRPELGEHAEIYPPIRENEAQGGMGKQDQKQWLDALGLFKNCKKGERKTPRRTSWWSDGGRQAPLRTKTKP